MTSSRQDSLTSTKAFGMVATNLLNEAMIVWIQKRTHKEG